MTSTFVEIYVQLCWSSNGPVNLNGSYLSAAFPTWDDGTAQDQTLIPNAGDLDNFTLQSPTMPTFRDSGVLDWSGSGGSSPEPVQLSAVDTSGTQHDQFRAFLAGVVLGIAGGALIAILGEFVGPLSKRRDRRSPKWSDSH